MPKRTWLLISAFAIVKVVLHFLANQKFGFHADELYYIALSKHLQWGYLDNGPFITCITRLSELLFGTSLFAYRVLPTLAAGATVAITGCTVYYLNGKSLAITIACLGVICSPAYLATSYFLQPVVFEHLFWSALVLFLIRYKQTDKSFYLYLAAVTLGIGILNKYTIVLYALALLPWFINNRKVLLPALLCLVMVAPTFIWQIQHNLPLLHYIGIVRAGTHVLSLGEFLFQFTFFHGAGVAVWLAGLSFLLLSKRHKNYQFIAWAFMATVGIFAALNGKIYYALGAFPALFAAGGVCWERMLQNRVVVWRYSFLVTLVLPAIIALPSVIPILPLKTTLQYFRLMHTYTSITAIFVWEDGRIHEIPQTYADMLGWQELADKTRQVMEKLEKSQQEKPTIFTDDYGIAGALSYYLPGCKIASPNNSLLLWSPGKLDVKPLLYVGKKKPDTKVVVATEQINTPHSRLAGTNIYLLTQPSAALQQDYTQQRNLFGAAYFNLQR